MMNQSTKIALPRIEERADDLFRLSGVVNKFIDVKRATMRQGRAETDGEHTLHLQFLAVAYAARYHPELDLGKVALYTLVHDLVEVYAGDINSLSASSQILAQKALTETLALRQLEGELGGAWPELITVLQRYEELAEPEARFVKCFDKCDPSFAHYNNGGEALRRMGIGTREELERMDSEVRQRVLPYAEGFPDVFALRQELFDRVARVAYTTL